MMSFIKKHPFYVSIGVILVVGIGMSLYSSSRKTPSGEQVAVTRGNIEQEILITGTVKAEKRVSLSFDRSGSVATLPYSIGDVVSQGATLSSLRNQTERADIAEAQASVGVANANLEGVLRGTRDEEIQVK